MNNTTSQVDKEMLPAAGLPDSATGPRGELLRMRQVLDLVPFSRTTLWRRVRAGHFPAHVRLGGPQSRVIAWWSSDVEAWLDSLQHGRGS